MEEGVRHLDANKKLLELGCLVVCLVHFNNSTFKVIQRLKKILGKLPHGEFPLLLKLFVGPLSEVL